MTNSLLIVTEEQKDAIRHHFNINEKELKSVVSTISDWYKKQKHLPGNELDRRLIERILISRNNSIEKTKKKIDTMFTLRTVIPDLASPRDITHPRIQKSLKGFNFVTLPKLNNDNTRVSVLQYKDPKYFNLTDLAIIVCMMAEHRLVHDYYIGERFIIDMTNFSVDHLTKYSPLICQYAEIYLRKAFGMRMVGTHIVNGLTWQHKLVSILKSGLSEKFASTIYTHDCNKDLYDVIDKNILPSDFGGEERSVDQLAEDWVKELSQKENREYLAEQEKLRSNENLRKEEKVNNKILGIAGTMKNFSSTEDGEIKSIS